MNIHNIRSHIITKLSMRSCRLLSPFIRVHCIQLVHVVRYLQRDIKKIIIDEMTINNKKLNELGQGRDRSVIYHCLIVCKVTHLIILHCNELLLLLFTHFDSQNKGQQRYNQCKDSQSNTLVLVLVSASDTISLSRLPLWCCCFVM